MRSTQLTTNLTLPISLRGRSDIKSVGIVLYSSLSSLPLRSLRSLRFNHSETTVNERTNVSTLMNRTSILDISKNYSSFQSDEIQQKAVGTSVLHSTEKCYIVEQAVRPVQDRLFWRCLFKSVGVADHPPDADSGNQCTKDLHTKSHFLRSFNHTKGKLSRSEILFFYII